MATKGHDKKQKETSKKIFKLHRPEIAKQWFTLTKDTEK